MDTKEWSRRLAGLVKDDLDAVAKELAGIRETINDAVTAKVIEYLEAQASQTRPFSAWLLRTIIRDLREGCHLTDSVRLHVAPLDVVEQEDAEVFKSGLRTVAHTIGLPLPGEIFWPSATGGIAVPENAIDPRVQLIYSVTDKEPTLGAGEPPRPWYDGLSFEEVRARLLAERAPGKALEVPPGFMDWMAGQKPEGPVVPGEHHNGWRSHHWTRQETSEALRQAPDDNGLGRNLKGHVVWHRHDGQTVKLVAVTEAEESIPGAKLYVSYEPDPERRPS